ncbi:molybdopterin oxidoreductase [Mangrovimicrobium sediminis]|uniref:Molybdopterin oxidoreductase n=1 Tax=Mangrovimicrobium sediminis TaxID=2562682 RepID=A0A4Z0M9Q9_9GAMM|nr:molybdopterin-dependent oxidoreductase [Haliea sp. SAOS-164]TGD76127.1 molybdopterin oxidoreductase [Haliea sp. SAOS-164]
MSDRPVELKRTYCKVCMVHCGLLAEVAGDQVLKVRGDPEHPLSAGYTCPKGRAVGQLHHSPEAIDRPLMRRNGRLEPVSWDEALDDIAARLRTLIDTHGGHSVAINFGSGLGLDSSGYAMEEALHQALGYGPKFTPLTIDGVAKVLMAGAMGGFPGLNPKTDYDAVEMLIYVGTNPMVSHAHNTGMYNPAVWIREAARRGEVWTIDPVFTETAKFSTRHIAAYPGKDYAILAWLVREIIDDGPLVPRQPVQGLDTLRAALEGYDLDTAAAVAGVDARDMRDLLAAIRRKGGNVVVETGTGITMSTGCNLTQWFAWLLMVLTGAMNNRGGTWFHPSFLHPYENFELPEMDPWTPGAKTRPDALGILGDWPCAVLPDEIDAGNIRGLFNFGGRLLRSFPDTNALERTLGDLELHVMTEILHNETTAFATHVLPTKDGIERAELSRWDTLGWNLSMQYSAPLVAPLGERRSAWWVISQIMRRAGLPVPAHVPDCEPTQEADEAMLAHLMTGARCSFEELQAKGYVERPLEFPAPWVDRHIERIGGWRLAPQRLVEQWNEMRALDAEQGDAPKPLCFSSRRQRRKFNAQLDFLGEEANALLHPLDAEAHGIRDGQMVRVSNDSGVVEFVARIDPGVRRGVVSISHGYLHSNVNRLTSTAAIDRLSGMAHYSGVPIAIEAVPG